MNGPIPSGKHLPARRLPAGLEPDQYAGVPIEILRDPIPKGDFSRLCVLLGECVRGGASIGFFEPLVESEAGSAAGAQAVSLRCLDASDGGGGAGGFCDAHGYACVGGIPGYALASGGAPVRNAIYRKALK